MLLRSRIRIVSFSLILLTPALLPAQEAPLHTASKQELDVIKVLLKQEDAWNHGDMDTFVQGFKDSPDTIFITHQISRGYTGMVEAYKRDYPSRAAMGLLSFSDLEVRTLDENCAVVIGKYHLERGKKDGGNAEGMFSDVLEKTDQGWKIVIDHSN
jgi:ketosteroid isomerase-like protein